MLLDHVSCAKLPGNVVEYIMNSKHLGNIERLFDRDPHISLTGNSILAIIKAPKLVARHLDVVNFLRKHRDRYSMSDVKLAVESIYMYSEDDELQAKKM